VHQDSRKCAAQRRHARLAGLAKGESDLDLPFAVGFNSSSRKTNDW
jgi:hypothetical protein